MAIKSKNTSNPKFPDWPKLMISNSGLLIVLFTAYRSGVVVHSDSDRFLPGYSSQTWDMEDFETYNGEVTLKND